MSGHPVVKLVLTSVLFVAVGCGSKDGKDSKDSKKDESGEKGGLGDAQRKEAKELLGAIARGAVGAYERESEGPADAEGVASFVHALCKSASPLPAKVPSKGEKVDVAKDAWDADAGWKCLKPKSPPASAHFQYSYQAGSGYKGLDRGAKDPGPDGFQICAEADAVPGGKSLLICQTGALNKETKVVKLAADLETLEE